MEINCQLFFEKKDEYDNLLFQVAKEDRGRLDNALAAMGGRMPVIGNLYKIKFTKTTLAPEIKSDEDLVGRILYCKVQLYNITYGGRKYTNIQMKNCFIHPPQ
jgi:hypothetical protein